MKIDVRDNFREVIADLRGLQRDLRDQVLAKALNETAGRGKVEAVRAVTSEFAIAASEIRPRIELRRASARGSRLVAEIEAFGRRKGQRSMNVIHFLERKVTLAEARRRAKAGTLAALRFRIKRVGGLKTIEGAFLGNNGRTVFRRIPGTVMASRGVSRGAKHREQIKPVQVIYLPQMFNSRTISTRVRRRILEVFPAEVARAAKFVLTRRRR